MSGSVEEYSFKNTEALFAARKLVNLEEIKYSAKIEIEVYTGNDGEPSSWGRGETKYNGSLQIAGSEYAKIIDFAVSFGYNLLQMPPIPLIIIEKSGDLPTIKHVLPQVIFEEDSFETKKGEKKRMVTLPFLIVAKPIKIKI